MFELKTFRHESSKRATVPVWMMRYVLVPAVQEELTMGQRLALKHLLVDPKEKERQEAERAAAEAAAEAAALRAEEAEAELSEAESEWTWETCSESEAEELEEDKPKKADLVPAASAPVKPVSTTFVKTFFSNEPSNTQKS